MNTNKVKTIRTLTVIILAVIVTIGVTVGICCYNYYGYLNYKHKYLENYFSKDENANISTSERIEKAIKWDFAGYSDDLNITFRDPNTKDNITGDKLDNQYAENVNAYFDDNHVLHLPKYFNFHFYQLVSYYTDSESKDIVYTPTYGFYLSDIKYNTIENFNVKNYYITFVEGIGEEADEALEDAIKDLNEKGISTGSPFTEYYYSMTDKDGSVLHTYYLYDNPDDVWEDDEDKEGNDYYIYNNITATSYDGQTLMRESKGLTFLLYYMDDSDSGNKEVKSIIEGTFQPELKDGEPLTGQEIYEKTNLEKGYNRDYYQESYSAFIRPKMILNGAITFGVTGIICGFLAFLWLYEPKQDSKASSKNNKKVTNKKAKK